ncbi:response regulator [Allohahella marinimesophila]|uniref:Response regulatory domain-containing protein n=1 Tax=Allohahella marinimesophila TaxID=1054972 RepID=A0ABP7NZ62_9GAMM
MIVRHPDNDRQVGYMSEPMADQVQHACGVRPPVEAPSQLQCDDPHIDESLHAFLLVEDHPLFIHGFRSAIERMFPHARLDIAGTGAAAQSLMLSQDYDLVFLDLHIPEISGFAVLEELRRRRVVQPVVIITGQVDSIIVDKARRLGALGAISKRIDLSRLAGLCVKLLDGQTIFEEGREWQEAPWRCWITVCRTAVV